MITWLPSACRRAAGMVCLVLPAAMTAAAAEPPDAPTAARVVTPPRASDIRFDLDALSRPPRVFPAEDELQADGVRGLYYEGPAFRGRATRVFAYYGVPQAHGKGADTKFPALVLIHGGGGTAFARWVKMWNARGYAALAMDLCGCVPVGTYGKWKRHDAGGPPGWDASFDQLDQPPTDQWTHQAVSSVLLAHSLVRSFPEVDAERIGVTGISWGGYVTCIVAGVDARFRFAVPVYGCGYLGDNSTWLPTFARLGPDKAALWLRQWDPAEYLGQVRMPMMWVNGTNDFAFPMDSWQKSYRLPKSPRTLCLRVRMPHGHGPPGEDPEEIRVLADALLRGGKPLATITAQGQTDGTAWATYRAEVPLETAELAFTRQAGRWQDRTWESVPATLDTHAGRVSAAIPADAQVFYLLLTDARKCVVSTEHVAAEPAALP